MVEWILMDWRTIDRIRNGLPLDQNVYDAAGWSCIFPLSRKSIANHSGSVKVSDITRGEGSSNKPVDTSCLTNGLVDEE